MKNLTQRFLQFSLLTLFVFLYSCGDDEETFDLPSITINSPVTGGSITAGSEVVVNFSVTAAGGYNNSTIDVIIDDQTVDSFVHSRDAGSPTTTFTSGDVTVYTVSEADAGKQLEIAVTVVDDTNQTNSSSVFVDMESSPVNTYTAVLLAAPLADDAATGTDERTSLTWFSTNLGERISSADVVSGTSSSADVDFGYAFITEANLGSPASYPSNVYDLSANGQNWSALNDTKFRETTLSNEDYLAADTFAELEDAFTNGTGETGLMEGLVVGDIVAFSTDAAKTTGSKKGLIKIVAIVDGDNNGTFFDELDYMEIEVIVQQ